MLGFILLAIANGMIIGTSRAVNGQLSLNIGPLKASFYNHLVGFTLLTLVLLSMGFFTLAVPVDIPFSLYLGGFLGALYVALNSLVLTRIGAMKTVLLVISGQMIIGVVLDYQQASPGDLWVQCIGVMLIIVGLYLSKRSTLPASKESPR